MMKLTTCGIAAAWLVLTGVNSLLAADLNVPADFATIQAAVNAASSGDTIHIAPGVYMEQTSITNKNLTLLGQPGTILRAFPGMQAAGPVSWRCVLYVYLSSNVVVRDLTFEGDQMADQNAGGLAGAQFDLSGGRVENCRFTGFRERLPGSVKAHAIAFWNDYSGAPLLQAEAVGNIIEDCYTGIQIGGAPDAKSFDFAIADNVISGVGPAITFEMACGIYIWEGAAGEVVRNTISGYSYVGDDWSTRGTPFSFGILGFGDGFPDHVRPLEPIRFADNVLRSNQVHVAFFKGDQGVFEDNTFKGYLPGTKPPLAVVPGGLWFSGGNVVVRRNHFSDLEQGIYLGGTNSIVGDALGHAINAQLTDNRFCDVANPTYSEPGASSTEEGTLACPFPDPVLRLSWPGIDEGFSVQSAPTPSGPWSTLDATPVRQDGQNNVTVPAASDQQFFRLAKP